MLRINVSPKLVEWAIKRSGSDKNVLSRKFSGLGKWLEGKASPTKNQLESFAKATGIPFGYFFWPEPPSPVDVRGLVSEIANKIITIRLAMDEIMDIVDEIDHEFDQIEKRNQNIIQRKTESAKRGSLKNA